MRGFKALNIALVLLYVGACAADWSIEFIAPELKHAKLRAMLQRMDSIGNDRKIVFVGTSPCDYGIEAAQVEKELGIAAFNVCHNGYDTPQILRRVSSRLSANDVLVYVARYPQDYGHPASHNKPQVASIAPNPFPRLGHWWSDGRYTAHGDQTVYGAAGLQGNDKPNAPGPTVPAGYWQETAGFLHDHLAEGAYQVVMLGAARPALAANESPGATTLRGAGADAAAGRPPRDVTLIPPVKIASATAYLDSLHLNQQGRAQWSHAIADALRSTVSSR